MAGVTNTQLQKDIRALGDGIRDKIEAMHDDIKAINGRLRDVEVSCSVHEKSIDTIEQELSSLEAKAERLGWLNSGLATLLSSVAAWLGTRY